jgi:hypothetical protein
LWGLRKPHFGTNVTKKTHCTADKLVFAMHQAAAIGFSVRLCQQLELVKRVNTVHFSKKYETCKLLEMIRSAKSSMKILMEKN